jgi:dTDP-glucose 4,6-dehydratase
VVIHLAAQALVRESYKDPVATFNTNVMGTINVIKAASTLATLSAQLIVTTDKVYENNGKSSGYIESDSLGGKDPYSASKASSDHLVRAWHHTYNLPTLITNCSNNYGPYQFPEKLIPLTIINALNGKSIPIYGDGKNVRDWLYVKDHCSAIRNILNNGSVGEVYNIGGSNEKTNLEVVRMLCNILDQIKPLENGLSYSDLIIFVKDRPGHDMRYAINAKKLEKNLKWKPSETFETGIRKTVEWYLENPEWVNELLSGDYKNWIQKHYS